MINVSLRRLVEWNRTVFEKFGPTAWVNILSGLTVPSEFWAAWPPEEHDKNSYWAKLIPSIIEVATTSKLPIFPLVSSDGSLSSTALNDDSISLAPLEPKVSLALLTRLRLLVVRPPAHIFNTLLVGVQPKLNVVGLQARYFFYYQLIYRISVSHIQRSAHLYSLAFYKILHWCSYLAKASQACLSPYRECLDSVYHCSYPY